MPNPDRPPVTFEHDGSTFKFVLNNAARRAAEKMSGMSMPQIAEGFFAETEEGIGQPSTTAVSAMFFGATRKFNSRVIRNASDVDDFMDEMDDGEPEHAQDFFVSLAAAALGQSKEELLSNMEGNQDDDEEEDGESEADEAPKAEAATPKASPKGSKSRSAAGKSSSSKE